LSVFDDLCGLHMKKVYVLLIEILIFAVLQSI
jgi:hypothetical protein